MSMRRAASAAGLLTVQRAGHPLLAFERLAMAGDDVDEAGASHRPYFSPRMIGSPVFELPMTTILVLLLAASFSVASMPFHSSS